MQTTFNTVILGVANNTGIEVPPARLAELGSNKRPPVLVTINGYTYRSTVGVMGGRSLVPLSRAHREASGLKADDQVTVTLELEQGPREMEVPPVLQSALERSGLSERFAALAYSKRKEFARQVSEAKAEATRARRVDQVMQVLR